jgi:hypothetical protein
MPTVAELRERAAAHQRELTERKLLTVRNLAERWQVAPTTVRDIPPDELPYLEFGRGLKLRRRRYDPQDVEMYERRHRRGAKAVKESAA